MSGRKFSSQEKLALMMTSAGSMRNLAALVGVSHQKIGRWLREGQEGGAKAIPNDPATLDAINTAFGIHSQIAREQARADGVPYLSAVPVYQAKKPRSDGRPSDRVFIEDARFLNDKLRQRLVQEQAKTQKYMTVTVRSEIDADQYFKELALQAIASGRKGSVRDVARQIKRGFEQREGKKIKTPTLALYTPREPIGKLGDRRIPPTYAAERVRDELRRKHEPSSVSSESKFADTFIFQLEPSRDPKQSRNNENTPKRKRAGKWSNKRGK